MSTKTRTRILDALKALLVTHFDKTSGTTSKVLRSVKRQQLMPASVFPAATVADNGQEGGDASEGTNEGDPRTLKARVYLHVSKVWDRESETQDWTDFVEQVIAVVIAWTSSVIVEEVRYVADDPFDVVFTSGATNAVWIIDFEVEYTEAANALSKWN